MCPTRQDAGRPARGRRASPILPGDGAHDDPGGEKVPLTAVAKAISLRTMTSFLTLPDGRLAHDTAGEGPLVVLSPGMGDVRGVFRDVAVALVAAGHRVVTTELRGHGESDASFPATGIPLIADDLVALVEHLGGPATLVGHSVSAGAAVLAAARRPDLVRSVVLVSPHLPAESGAGAGLVARLMTQAIRRPVGTALWIAFYRSLYRGRRPAWFDEHLGELRRALRGRHLVAFGRLARTLATTTTPLPLDRLTVPTLVVHGELDPEFPEPAAELARALAALTGLPADGPGAPRGLLVAEAGHYPHAQRPDVVVPALLDHLARTRA